MITDFGVSVSRKCDIGFAPYMEYLESLHGRNPAFGTRENSTVEVTFWAKGTLAEGETLDDKAPELAKKLEELINAHLANNGIKV